MQIIDIGYYIRAYRPFTCGASLKRETAMTDQQKLQSQLEERLASLDRRVAGLEGDLRSTHSQDWEERASEISGDEVLEGLESAALDEIAQIQAALKRIKSGEYGVCHNCAKDIGAERLAALPFALLCINCASQAEY